MKNKYEVGDIFRRYCKDYQKENILSFKKLKVMHNISVCRTAHRTHKKTVICSKCGDIHHGEGFQECENCGNPLPVND